MSEVERPAMSEVERPAMSEVERPAMSEVEWRSHRDSNPDSSFRRAVCYPLHYGSRRIEEEESCDSRYLGSMLFLCI